MGIKFYDSNGKYWGEYDETRNLFIPSEEPITKTETQNSNLTFDTPQTEERPAGCSKDWSTSCTSCERYFSCDYLSGRQTDYGWGKPTTVSHREDKED